MVKFIDVKFKFISFEFFGMKNVGKPFSMHE